MVVVLMLGIEHHIEVARRKRTGHHARDLDLEAVRRQARQRCMQAGLVSPQVEQGGDQHVARNARRAFEIERLSHDYSPLRAARA